jgi:hypothetical protein
MPFMVTAVVLHPPCTTLDLLLADWNQPDGNRKSYQQTRLP